MKPPTINLARRPFRNNTAHYAVFGICFTILMAASAYNAYDFVSTGSGLTRFQVELAARTGRYQELNGEVEQMKLEVGRIDLGTLNKKSDFANGLILSKLFSWSVLFDRIEELIPPEVKIRSIRPAISPKTIEIQVDGLAQTAEALYEFEAALDGAEYFAGVYPVAESTRETRTEINFDLMMNYIAAGKTRSQPRIPPTPTAGLPQPERAAAEETQTAAGGPDTAGSGADAPAQGAAQAVTTEAVEAPPPTQPGSQPTAAGPTSPAPPETAPAAPVAAPSPGPGSTKPPREMTNREMIDAFGQERFVRMRGRFTAKQGPDAALSNADYIKQRGMEAFLKTRGDLGWADHNVPPRPTEPLPGGSLP